MKSILKVFVIFSIFSIVSCTTIESKKHSISTWVINPYDEEYPENEYLLATGSAKGRNPAIDDAVASLSSIFSSSVEGVMLSSSSDTGITSSSSYEAFVNVQSRLDEIVGLEIYDVVVDREGIFHARVGINKEEAVMILRSRLDDIEQRMDSVINNAKSEGTIEALSLLSSVKEDAKKADSYELQLYVIAKALPHNYEETLKTQISSILMGLDVSVRSSSNFTQIPSSTLKETLSAILSEKGLHMVETGEDLCVDIVLNGDRSDDNPSGYIIDNASLTLTLSDRKGSLTKKSDWTITSIDVYQADSNMLKRIKTETEILLNQVL